MTESEINYFATSSHVLPEDLIKVVEDMQQQLAAEIQNGDIQINPSPQVIKANPTKAKSINNLHKKMRELGAIKQQLSNKLKMIDAEQKQLKALSTKIQKQRNKSKLQRSTLTQEDKQHLLTVKRSQKQYEAMIRKRIQNIMKQIQEKQKQKQTEKLFKDDLKRKQRIVKMVEKRAKLQQSRSKTLNMLQNSHLSIKRNQYTYILNQVKDKKLEQQRKKYHKILLNEKKQKQKVDFNEIKNHAVAHDQLIKDKKQEFMFEMKESQIRKRTKTISYESEFSRKIKEEAEAIENKKRKQQNFKQDVRLRVSEFQEYISSKFKPKANENSIFVSKKLSQKLDGLSYEQRHEKGNQYLDVCKKKAKKLTSQQMVKLETDSDKIGPTQTLPTSSSQRYPNYLLELRKNKSRNPNFLDKLLKQKRLTNRKVEQVIRWMLKKEEGTKIGQHKGYIKTEISSAMDKVKLLNSMYQIE